MLVDVDEGVRVVTKKEERRESMYGCKGEVYKRKCEMRKEEKKGPQKTQKKEAQGSFSNAFVH